MSNFQVGYTLVVMISLVLGIGFSFIGGMRLWVIGFFILAIMHVFLLLIF